MPANTPSSTSSSPTSIRASSDLNRPVLITGGAGFIGSNLASALLAVGQRVRIYDSLARAGVEANLAWLREQYGDALEWIEADVRDEDQLDRALADVSAVYHLAAQVAVTSSLVDPREDFEINARATLGLLELLRAREHPIPLIFTSTNKVYGALDDVRLDELDRRWWPHSPELAANGIDERRTLAFCSPYGCSKGAADQYVLDWAHSFGMPTVVLRMSCIYGPRQFGTEEQGWIAHFINQAIRGRSITIYGDGKQVRDVLFIDDLVAALQLARRDIELVAGRAFNLGGGPARAVSLHEVLAIIEEQIGGRIPRDFGSWRRGDQRYYVSDTRAFEHATGWSAKIDVRSGIRRLFEWRIGERERALGAARRTASI